MGGKEKRQTLIVKKGDFSNRRQNNGIRIRIRKKKAPPPSRLEGSIIERTKQTNRRKGRYGKAQTETT